MTNSTRANALANRIADRLLVSALAGFFLYKAFETFLLEPLAAGPDFRAYIAPCAEMLTTLFVIVFALSNRWLPALVSSFVLFVIGAGYWLFFVHAVPADFEWFVAPNLFVFGIAIISFFFHTRPFTNAEGGSNA